MKKRDHFFIQGQGKGKFIRIIIDDIFFLESTGNYTKVHLCNNMHLTHASLKEMERVIEADHFMRVHKSFVVNMNKIISIDGNMIQLFNNARINLGPHYQKNFFDYIFPVK